MSRSAPRAHRPDAAQEGQGFLASTEFHVIGEGLEHEGADDGADRVDGDAFPFEDQRHPPTRMGRG